MSTATDPLADVVDVASQLRVLEEALVGLGPELVPERIAKHQLGQVVRSLGRIERCAGGARVVLTKAAADVGVWKAQGFKSPAEWAARENGTTTGQAAAELETSGQLAALPATRDAVAAGEVSTDAARAVAAGATADRKVEADLLAKARKGDLTAARQGARKARLRADERDGKAAERMHKRRQLRAWVEVDGEGRGQWNVPPAYQAVFLAALEPYRQEAFRQARAAGQRPSHEALMADALQLLCLDTLADNDLPVPPTPDGHPPGPTGPDRSGPIGREAGSPASDGPVRSGPSTDPDLDAASDPDGAGSEARGAGPGRRASPGRGEATDSGDDRVEGSDPVASTGDPTDPGGAHPGADDPDPDPDADPDSRRSGDPDSEAEPTLFGGDRSLSGASGPEPHGSSGTAASAATPPGKKPPRRHRRAPAQIHFHCDVTAWLRGHPQDDELCQIPGLGPVPLSLVKAFENDSVLKLILRNGDDITAITSHRRYIPAALRTALEARDHECVVPGCHVTRGLQVDHVQDFAEDGPTALWNNAFLCVFHHYLKTHCGWILRGPPGQWTFTPPDTS